MEIKERPLVSPPPTHPATHNFECLRMLGRERVLGPKTGVGQKRGSGRKADQKHFQVQIKLRRLQEANLMGNVPCSPCSLLWLPKGRGLGCDVAHQRNPRVPDLIQMSGCERLKR